MASPEVVDAERDADRLERVQGRQRPVGSVHDLGLGDLQAEEAGLEHRPLEGRLHNLSKPRVADVRGRYVDRDLDLEPAFAPIPGLLQACGKDPMRNPADQAGLLRHGDEAVGEDQPESRCCQRTRPSTASTLPVARFSLGW
jgi:hypothetical protein